MSFLCFLQILMNARRGGTPVPTTQCASTWKEAMTAGAPTGTTAPAIVSMTTRSSTVGRSGCWTAIGALCAPARWETDGDRHGKHRDKKAEVQIRRRKLTRQMDLSTETDKFKIWVEWRQIKAEEMCSMSQIIEQWWRLSFCYYMCTQIV